MLLKSRYSCGINTTYYIYVRQFIRYRRVISHESKTCTYVYIHISSSICFFPPLYGAESYKLCSDFPFLTPDRVLTIGLCVPSLGAAGGGGKNGISVVEILNRNDTPTSLFFLSLLSHSLPLSLFLFLSFFLSLFLFFFLYLSLSVFYASVLCLKRDRKERERNR